MDIRRVGSGHDANGTAVFVSDERVPPIVPDLLPGNELHRLWGADEPPHLAGDTVVQNGARHRWSNRGTEPCLLAVILLGGHHDKVG